ncbi:hypothetical protein O6P43_021781 [Quillaja saponaria]|uniref:Uncharacterized protein n=1 Tax=Quillaja saponaria TaxID=32244 RepID=A0AAD7LBN1_QUISA|nr:hypothetical protein O6P43_021781 [Quillaja saponaria]
MIQLFVMLYKELRPPNFILKKTEQKQSIIRINTHTSLLRFNNMAPQADHLAKVAMEGFEMIDKLYGRQATATANNRRSSSSTLSSRQGPITQSDCQYKYIPTYVGTPVVQMKVPEDIRCSEAAERFGGYVIKDYPNRDRFVGKNY